jgi:hypothetical protein
MFVVSNWAGKIENMNLDLFGWFMDSNEKNKETLKGLKLLEKSNRSIVVFFEAFDSITLSDSATVERFELRFESDNLRKVPGGYTIQIFAYKDNDLMKLSE